MIKSTTDSFNKLLEHRNASTLPKFLRPSLSPQFKLKILGKDVPQAQMSADKVRDTLLTAHKTILDTIINQKLNELALLKAQLGSFFNDTKTQIFADAIAAGITVEEHSKTTAHALIENYIKNAKAKSELNLLNNVVKQKVDKENKKIVLDADMSANVLDDNKSELVSMIQAEIQKALKKDKSSLKPILKGQKPPKNAQQQTKNRSRKKKNSSPSRPESNNSPSRLRSASRAQGHRRRAQAPGSSPQQKDKGKDSQNESNRQQSRPPRHRTKDTRKEKGKGNSTPTKSRSRSRSIRWKPKQSAPQQGRRKW
jgi:hypothetical protein